MGREREWGGGEGASERACENFLQARRRRGALRFSVAPWGVTGNGIRMGRRARAGQQPNTRAVPVGNIKCTNRGRVRVDGGLPGEMHVRIFGEAPPSRGSESFFFHKKKREINRVECHLPGHVPLV
jgi:hypothetical protein